MPSQCRRGATGAGLLKPLTLGHLKLLPLSTLRCIEQGARRKLDKDRRDKAMGLDDVTVGIKDGKQNGKEETIAEASKGGVSKMEVDDSTTVKEVKPCGSTGMYQLNGVVTHKGRSADSGHYIGWVRQGGDDWLKFDDDIVTPIKVH